MKKHPQLILEPKDKRGVTAIVLCLMMAILIGFAVLAVDVGHLFVARNELQNAADAGALAGARLLINEDGTINSGANQIANDAATANKSEGEAVEVKDWSSNGGDVQRGHWSLATHTFTPNPSLIPTELWGKTLQDLDADPDFINAVKVRTRRETTPVASFFANIFGHQGFTMESEAVAYIGFAGTLQKWEVDQPIAICEESLLGLNGEYQCHVGRMINSGQNVESHETGGWTDFNQIGNPCAGGTNAPTVRSLVCGEGNPNPITLGKPIATSGGEIQVAFNDLINCWESMTGKTRPWNLTLPVIECLGNNVGTCEKVVGTVNINIIWITGAGEDPNYNEAPRQMEETNPYGTFVCTDSSNGELCWNEFVDHFNLQNLGEHSPAPYQKKSIYFLPDCTYHEPAGGTGGQNFGVLAKIPVLVQ